MELWAVGYPSGADAIPSFAGSSDAACLPDEGYAFLWGYDASKDDLYVIDQAGQVSYYLDLGQRSLNSSANRDEVDGVVRGLLGG